MRSLKPFFILALVFCAGTLLLLAWSRECQGDGSGKKWELDSSLDPQSDSTLEPLPNSSSQSDDDGARLKQTEARPNIMLVTAVDSARCETERGTEFTLKSVQNKIDYARLHNVSIWNSLEMLDPKFDDYWIKIVLLKSVILAHPHIEWFLWIDVDVLITDMRMRIPLEKYDGYDLVFHGEKKRVLEDPDWLGLNTGVFLIRNTGWSMDILNALLETGEVGEIRDSFGRLFNEKLKGRKEAAERFPADDQSSTIYLLANFPEKWATRTYIDEEFKYSSWFMGLLPTLEEIEQGRPDVKLPFTCHFNGCKFCHGHGDVERAGTCIDTFDRFYHYANDQVLRSLGLKHKVLGSPEIVKIQDQVGQGTDEA